MSCAMHSPCISQSPQNNILEKIAAKTRQRIAKERQEISDSELEQQAYEIAQKELAQEGAFTFPFEKALAKSGVSFICEVKKASLQRESSLKNSIILKSLDPTKKQVLMLFPA